MARVLVGVTGGIAAYKACELVRLLVRAGHEVVPLLTPGAERFVAAETFRALARSRAGAEPFPHLERADLLVVAPCSANTLAKLAAGLADNLVTETALAHAGLTLVAPTMNPRMWAHPATQANARVLRERGVEFAGPEEGDTAEGERGVGRMAEPEELLRRCALLLEGRTRLSGRRVLVTAGGTREPLDAVRFVGNRSSGRMGVALAAEAARRGGRVTLLAANLQVPAPADVELVETPTAADLERETLAHAPAADLVLMAAAVADYRPAHARSDKRPKDGAAWTVELEPTTDVLRALAEQPADGRVTVGFAAETGPGGAARAREKLEQKALDLIVVNDVSRADVGFDSPENEVVLIGRDRERAVARAPKEQIAAAVLDEAVRLLEERRG
ncbi:MAG: bifunctional phosphopantothenoylcysteine decarboxylase/phosphopantothenate--cysteine ligase CoaBC [Thermoleophilia bacterium]|nr:bifunctional phosphopantothenoylcysteine decarboxylase/phosphopantothenate--cysteine ligase CoaBC [Thermoleophilia bacterium]